MKEEYKYIISSLEPNWDYSTMPYTPNGKYRCFWIFTNEKELADMVWKNVKDYDGAIYFGL